METEYTEDMKLHNENRKHNILGGNYKRYETNESQITNNDIKCQNNGSILVLMRGKIKY